MMRDAATCDRELCIAVFLEPLDMPEEKTTEDAAREAGWLYDGTGHTCPACAIGRGPVGERGECVRCMGATFDRADANTCHYCGHTVPHPPGSGEW